MLNNREAEPVLSLILIRLAAENYSLRQQLMDAHSELHMLRTENRYLYRELEGGLAKEEAASKFSQKKEVVDPKDPYKILGVNKDILRSLAPEDALGLLHRIYLSYARYIHPDKGGSSEDFKNVKEAYDFLVDMVNRG